MKLLVLLIFFNCCVCAQGRLKEFTVTFHVNSNNLEGEKVYLEYQYADHLGGKTIDSQYILSSKAVFKGLICQPATAQVSTTFKMPSSSIIDMLPPGFSLDLPGNKLYNSYEFFLMPGNTTITTDEFIDESTITGASAVLDFELLRQANLSQDSILTDMFPRLTKCLKYADTACANQVQAEVDREMAHTRKIFFNYCKDHPASPVALYALRKSFPPDLDSPAVYLGLLSKLSPELKRYPEAQAFKKTLENIPNARVGEYVKDFNQFDTAGNPVSFRSFRGRFVLLYFWNSYSYAYFKIHNDVLSLWNKYQNRNFTIVSSGLETSQSKNKWLNVVRVYKTPWIQLTDFKGVSNRAAERLGVINIPYILLVNPEGKIILNNSGLKEIDQFLEKQLK